MRSNNYEYIKELAKYELVKKLTDEEVANIIMKMFGIQDISEIPFYFKNSNKVELENAVEKLKKISASNKTQVARIIRITRKVIARIWDKQ